HAPAPPRLPYPSPATRRARPAPPPCPASWRPLAAPPAHHASDRARPSAGEIPPSPPPLPSAFPRDERTPPLPNASDRDAAAHSSCDPAAATGNECLARRTPACPASTDASTSQPADVSCPALRRSTARAERQDRMI